LRRVQLLPQDFDHDVAVRHHAHRGWISVATVNDDYIANVELPHESGGVQSAVVGRA
jgi:hypothetical protein